MRKLTLDTSCVIHAVQRQAHAAAVEDLVKAASAGRVALFLTAAFTADLSRASAENRGANLAWLAEQPILRGVPGPFRLDYSRLDGDDVLVSDEEAVVITRIENIVLQPHPRRCHAHSHERFDGWLLRRCSSSSR